MLRICLIGAMELSSRKTAQVPTGTGMLAMAPKVGRRIAESPDLGRSSRILSGSWKEAWSGLSPPYSMLVLELILRENVRWDRVSKTWDSSC
jgi:hypothetical protein